MYAWTSEKINRINSVQMGKMSIKAELMKAVRDVTSITCVDVMGVSDLLGLMPG